MIIETTICLKSKIPVSDEYECFSIKMMGSDLELAKISATNTFKAKHPHLADEELLFSQIQTA